MPKKTKAEKRLAHIHKKYRLLNLETPLTRPSVSDIPKIELNAQVSNQDVTTIRFFYTDFKKSLTIILLIITLEFSLYFASMFTYLKLFSKN